MKYIIYIDIYTYIYIMHIYIHILPYVSIFYLPVWRTFPVWIIACPFQAASVERQRTLDIALQEWANLLCHRKATRHVGRPVARLNVDLLTFRNPILPFFVEVQVAEENANTRWSKWRRCWRHRFWYANLCWITELLPMFDVVFICFYLSNFLYFHLLLGLFRCFIFVLLISNILYYLFLQLVPRWWRWRRVEVQWWWRS